MVTLTVDSNMSSYIQMPNRADLSGDYHGRACRIKSEL